MAAGGNLVMPAPVSATASWAERRPQPGLDSAWASCSSYGASSRSITSDSLPISAVRPSMRSSMACQQGGVLGGEELRAVHGVLQLGDLAAGPGAGQLGQYLGVAFPRDQVVHDVPAGDPVQVGDHGRQLDRR